MSAHPTRRLVLLGALGAGLAACARSDSSAPGSPSTVPATPATATPEPTPSGDPSPPPDTVPLPTEFITIDRGLTDPELGTQVLVTKMARDMAWPPGHSAEQTAYEIVGVEMRWTPSPKYAAPIRSVDFSISTTAQFPNRPDPILNPTLVAAGWTVLPEQLTVTNLPAGQTSSVGWMIFKIDPRGAGALRLDYTRPATKLTDSGTTLPRTVLSVDLIG